MVPHSHWHLNRVLLCLSELPLAITVHFPNVLPMTLAGAIVLGILAALLPLFSCLTEMFLRTRHAHPYFAVQAPVKKLNRFLGSAGTGDNLVFSYRLHPLIKCSTQFFFGCFMAHRRIHSSRSMN